MGLIVTKETQTAEQQSGSIIFHKILYVSCESVKQPQPGQVTEPFTNELQHNKSQLPLANPLDLFQKSHFFVTSSDAVS